MAVVTVAVDSWVKILAALLAVEDDEEEEDEEV